MRSRGRRLLQLPLIVGIFTALCSLPLFADSLYGPYHAELVRVIDGDTVEVNAHIWPGLVQNIRIRLDGVDTPEKRGSSACEKAAAQDATTFTQRWFRSVAQFTIHDIHPGKYAGRMLGNIRSGHNDLATALIASGHARPYQGGTRQPWCQP